MSKAFFVKLQNRGPIYIEGEDRFEFLQNLTTNDVAPLQDNKPVYSALLTAQGKFLHDFFILPGDGFLLLDCEGGERAQDLYKRLSMYRLRAKIKISVEEHTDVYAVFGAEEGYADPRHEKMGWRSFERPQDIEEKPFEEWDRRRIELTTPDGSRDIKPERDTILDFHFERLNGVSFEKGCYVGQEVTARMKHRGLLKKHLYKIEGENLPAPNTDIHVNGKLMGEMRSSCGDIGLALLKDDLIGEFKNSPYAVISKKRE